MFYETQKNLKVRYRTGLDDILNDFYIPVLSNAVRYDRAAGYFSSNILVSYIEGLEKFINNNGKMRLLISPFLSYEDGKAIIEAANPDVLLSSKVSELFQSYKSGDRIINLSAQILYRLIKEKILEIKIVKPKNSFGLFHEKVSIFYDEIGGIIATEGSNNETQSAILNNLEAFSVFRSWINGQDEYIKQFKEDFLKIWDNTLENFESLNLFDAVDQDILKIYDSGKNISELYSEIKKLNILHASKIEVKTTKKLDFRPYNYQLVAIDNWMAQRKGIISFATGTGKTKTAIYGINKLINEYSKKIFLIVVPDKTLVNQWADNDISKYWKNIVKCYSENSKWEKELRSQIDYYEIDILDSPLFVITTIDTFKTERFQYQVAKLKNDYVFIADECHRFGTESGLNSLPNGVEWRLGLSATPEIYMSPQKTERLFQYFNGIIAEYSLSDAINNGQLTPYEYYPMIVKLNDEEKNKYKEISHKIIKMIGDTEDTDWDNLPPAAEMLLFRRARIIYGAAEKLTELSRLLDSLVDTKNMIIYCGATSINETAENEEVKHENENVGIRQIDLVTKLLVSKNIVPARYTKDENGQVRKAHIDRLKNGIVNVLVAIKALDEGVDIPQMDMGIILASSGNPREFVQRRGRLLRKYDGKDKAVIYDFVVLDDDEGFDSMNKTEVQRVYEFMKDSMNSTEVEKRFKLYFDKYLNNEGENKYAE